MIDNLKELGLAAFIAVAIAFAPVARAEQTLVYTDHTGTKLVLYSDHCKLEVAVAQLIKHGVPESVAFMAERAEVLDAAKSHEACYVVSPGGYVLAVAPGIGGGIMVLPVDVFVPQEPI